MSFRYEGGNKLLSFIIYMSVESLLKWADKKNIKLLLRKHNITKWILSLTQPHKISL